MKNCSKVPAVENNLWLSGWGGDHPGIVTGLTDISTLVVSCNIIFYYILSNVLHF